MGCFAKSPWVVALGLGKRLEFFYLIMGYILLHGSYALVWVFCERSLATWKCYMSVVVLHGA